MRCDAFACGGDVDTVGAGDSFLAGVMAALCYYAAPPHQSTPATGGGNTRASTGGTGCTGGAGGTGGPPTLEHILEVGMASALWKVDTARDYPSSATATSGKGGGKGKNGNDAAYLCPPLEELIASLPSLKRLEPPNTALR